VRRALTEAIGALDRRFQFIYDGEAYRIGDALIEHGNRYDRFNVVDHDGLRRRRAYQSRDQENLSGDGFAAPVGSRLVAQFINPMKSKYAFVDLLKPETPTILPILLVLEPSTRSELLKLLRISAPASLRGTDSTQPDMPRRLRDASAFDITDAPMAADDALLESLSQTFKSRSAAQRFLDDLVGPQQAEPARNPIIDASANGREVALSLLHLLRVGLKAPIEARLPALRRALRTLQDDKTFHLNVETDPAYLDAAIALCKHGRVTHVVFGHTHLAREIRISARSKYLNSGTWANLLRVPDVVLSEAVPDDAALKDWLESLRLNKLDTFFRPTFVRIDLNDAQKVITAHTFPADISDLTAT
jgi:hypothetical protein